MDPADASAKLKSLVMDMLAPGTRIQRSGGGASEGSWWFRLMWSGKTFDLRIQTEQWIEEQRDLVALRARFAAPAPEATRGGLGLWIHVGDRRIAGDTFSFEFQLYEQPQAPPRTAWVRVPVPTAVVYADHARDIGREPHAYLLATVLWELKDHLDKPGNPQDTIRHTLGPTIRSREPASEEEIRAYAELRLRQAYRIAGEAASVRFDWTDLEYLGVTQDDFMRAVMASHQQDWVVAGARLTLTQSFASKCDAPLVDSEGGGT